MTADAHRLDALRCADQDREVVAQVLNNAYAEGRLTFDEHADRITQAYDAKTFGQLNVLTTDLVAMPGSFRRDPTPTEPASPYSPPPAVPSYQPYQGDVVGTAFTGGNALCSTYRPGRVGQVAERVNLNAWLGECRIDFVDATFISADTVIAVGSMMGEIKIRVPEGVEVVTSGVSPLLGEVKVLGARPRPGGPRLHLQGTIVMAEILVIGPDAPRRKFERFKP